MTLKNIHFKIIYLNLEKSNNKVYFTGSKKETIVEKTII
jgi:hypothetical protein